MSDAQYHDSVLPYARNDIPTARKHLWWGLRALLMAGAAILRCARLLLIAAGHVIVLVGILVGGILKRAGRAVIWIMNRNLPRHVRPVRPRPVVPV